MAKQTGLGDNFFVDQFDLSGDIGALGATGGGNAPLEVTGIKQKAFDRLGGVRDGRTEYTSYFNPGTDAAHDALSSLPTTDRIVSWFRGTALGGQASALVSKQIDYAPTRNADGSLTFEVSAQANGFGVEFGHNLTGAGGDLVIRNSTAAENLTGFTDVSAATDFGLQAYLHVFAFTGTSVTIRLQDSDDNGAVDPYANIGSAAFATVTAVGAQRIQTGRTENVKKWIRVSTSGTYSVCNFAVIVVRNLTSVVF